MMSNAIISNLKEQKYLAFIHESYLVNIYNNPYFITSMFPVLFSYGIGCLDMQQSTIEVSLKWHVKYLLDLEDEMHKFSRQHLFPLISLNKNKYVSKLN